MSRNQVELPLKTRARGRRSRTTSGAAWERCSARHGSPDGLRQLVDRLVA